MSSISLRNKFMALVVPDGDSNLSKSFFSFPYQKNIIGTFNLSGTSTNQSFKQNNYSTSNGVARTTALLSENDSKLSHYLSFAALPDNAIVYMDMTQANSAVTVAKEEGIPIALQTDNLSEQIKTLYSQADG